MTYWQRVFTLRLYVRAILGDHSRKYKVARSFFIVERNIYSVGCNSIDDCA